MNSFKIKKKLEQSYFFKALLLNIGILLLLFLFFKPTLKSDDYYLGEIIYGSALGEYDIHLVYNNILLGYIIKFLLHLFPKVAWYAILQVIFVFYAFTLLTYWLLKKKLSRYSIIFEVAILIIFGYECYIRITFTKTAAILMAVGFICLFWILEEEKKDIRLFCLAFLSVFLGLLYRKAILNSVLAILVGIIFMKVFFSFSERKFKKAFGTMFIYGLLVFSVLFTDKILTKYNYYVYSQDTEWSEYFANNKWKSQIVDYTTNNYEDYQNEYLKMGVSVNDLSLIYQNDLYDGEYLTSDRIEGIIALANKGRDTNFFKEVIKFSNIIDFLRIVPWAYLQTFCFSAYIILTIFIFFVENRKKAIFLWIYSIIVMLGENYYLYLQGRVLQPHVDFCIIFSACLLLLFEIKSDCDKRKHESKKTLPFLTILIVIFNALITFYNSISAPYFINYGSDNACNPQKSREIMDVLTEDKENLYVTTSRESVYSKWSFDTFEVIPKGYFGNIFSLGSALWPSQRVAIKNYNVKNVYRELTNSDHIYFFISDDLEESGIRGIETYIQEHYEKNAKMIKVKEFESINIYRCISGELEISEFPKGEKAIQTELQAIIDENVIYISGTCYVENSNSYNQNSYVEIVDTETNQKFFYNTLQKENKKNRDNMNGRFSEIESYIEIPNYWSKEDKISIVLQADGYSYKVPLNVKEQN